MKQNHLVSMFAASVLALGAVSLAAQADGTTKKKGDAAQKEKSKDSKNHPALEIGAKVPDFTATDVNGKQVKFSEYAGKTVVLEWINPDCPVCRKVTESGLVKKMITDAKAIDPNVVFLMVNSTASMASEPKKSADYLAGHGVQANAALIDGDGKIGRMFGAKTTPHLFVVDSKGTLVYSGAIDDSADRGESAGKTNYVINALTQLKAGQSVSPGSTKAYGCSVKYAKGS